MVTKLYIEHEGVKRRSGRYPWGSGNDPYQHGGNFLRIVSELTDKGMSETEIAKALGMNTRELREKKHIERIERRAQDAAFALKLHDKGYSTSAIAERMGKNESSVRGLLDPALSERAQITKNTANELKRMLENNYIDIGLGSEQYMGISRTKLKNAVAILKEEGYEVHTILVPQVTNPGKFTKLQVLAPPGKSLTDVSKERSKIIIPETYSEDGGRSYQTSLVKPIFISGDRVLVRYDEDGGGSKDGLIELRRGVDDIGLGHDNYSQVRIGVDGKYYMKGMAVYGDDIPLGVDIIYNTSKKKGTALVDVYKEVEEGNAPFKSSIRPQYYIDSEGNVKLSAINKVVLSGHQDITGEGSWETWSRNLSSQFLSKQSYYLAKRQLSLDEQLKREQFDEIMSITNPTLKKIMLKQFSDQMDTAAVDLKGAALPRQASQVILPINSLKDNEVYAPNYRHGEVVVLVRHPHGGIFEIPILVVNNKNQEGVRLLTKTATDAVGINANVARQLSGADFDGDSVIVIPNNKGLIKTSPPLAALKDFDPKTSYPYYEGMKKMSKGLKQTEMGKITNLIADMTVKGASFDEIARAVKHSMVVIDAEKHGLNYKLSYDENGIEALKKKYQDGGGASTIITRASSELRIPHREEGEYITSPDGKTKRVYIDEDGNYRYRETGKTVKTKDGDIVPRTTKTTQMAYVRDAKALSSGEYMEEIYANYANKMKDMAREARKAMLNTVDIDYSPSARKTYQAEVDDLMTQLKAVYKNKPRERQANLIAARIVGLRKKSNPDLTQDELKKIKQQVLEDVRARIGAKRVPISISDMQWEAIQAGGVSPSSLFHILSNSDRDTLLQKAIPRTKKGLSEARLSRAKAMLRNGSTRAEVADVLGITTKVLWDALKEGD